MIVRITSDWRVMAAAGTACALLLGAAPAMAQTASPGLSGAPARPGVSSAGGSGTLGSGTDCTKVSVDYTDDPSLTPEERLAAMDRALDRSLAKFDACQSESQQAAAGGGGASGSSGGAPGGGSGEAAANGNGMVSSAEGGMSGAETGEGSAPQVASRPNGELGTAAAAGGGEWTKPEDLPGTIAAPNGKVPDDIPPADNDSVIEAQIRQAALNERDPEVRARLWDEYRRYKGLPPGKGAPAETNGAAGNAAAGQ